MWKFSIMHIMSLLPEDRESKYDNQDGLKPGYNTYISIPSTTKYQVKKGVGHQKLQSC